MSDDDISFDRDFPLPVGTVEEVAPGIRRIVAPNPGPFTFTGTVTYIVGTGKVAIIDPGPKGDAHRDAVLDAVRGESVTHVLVTHTHRDHSPGAAAIKAATGATVLAQGVHRAARPSHENEKPALEAGNDRDFAPDALLADGEVVTGGDWALEAVAVPGHTANHMVYAWLGRGLTFVGDHIMGWSTSVVAPPDGSMADYMASLEKVAAREEDIYFPAHGPHIREARRFARSYIRHRQGREAAILYRLAKGAADIPTLVRAIYIGIDPRLVPAAGLSVLAHMEDLAERGVVATDGTPTLEGVYRLAGPLPG
jgi:glyoxylase-like metal-dependent hydrolase (beta-lactamase superfamily II)